MKRILAAAALAALGSVCHAQSDPLNITLYGRFDAGIDYTSGLRASNGGPAVSRWSAQSGEWGASWLGFKGNEDLGNGNAAVFNLEAGLNLIKGIETASGDGTGNAFSRRANAGLQSRDYGTLLLGRDIFLPCSQWDMDPLMQEAYSATSLMHNRNAPIVNNMLEYQSPVIAGVDALLQYALGGQSSGFNEGNVGGYGRSDALQLTYTTTVAEWRLQFDELRDADGKFSNIFVDSRELFLGAALKLTPKATLQLGYNHLTAPDTAAGLADTANQYTVGGKFQPNKTWLFSAAVYRMLVGAGAGDATHDAGGHATMVGLGAMYYFSPVTFLYVTAARVKNGSTSSFGLIGINPGSDNNNLNNPAIGHPESGVYAGLNTSF